jgi:hypothetical protein
MGLTVCILLIAHFASANVVASFTGYSALPYEWFAGLRDEASEPIP